MLRGVMFSRYVLRPTIHMLKSRTFSQIDEEKVSTLFVPGRHGNIYQIVKPLIDPNDIIANLNEIKLNCDKRGIPINTEGLIPKIEEWRDLKQIVSELSGRVNEIRSDNDRNPKNLQQSVFDQFHTHKKTLYDLEDHLMSVFRSIPNKLHPKTPTADVLNVRIQPKPFGFEMKSHSEIGQKMECLEFLRLSYASYYLSGVLSELEIAIQNYVCDHLLSAGFVPISSVDFSKSFILEGCGKSLPSVDQSIPLQAQGQQFGQRIHLVGSSSMESLCSHFVNMNLSKLSLPMKYFSAGRVYNADQRNHSKQSLFTVMQSTCIHCILVSEISTADSCYEMLYNELISIFSNLCIPFQTTDVSSSNLNPVESRKVKFELWSAYEQRYVSCGEVVQCDDFVSKRLHMMFGEDHVREGYLNIVHGICVNVPILIACIVENLQKSNTTFTIPAELKKYMM